MKNVSRRDVIYRIYFNNDTFYLNFRKIATKNNVKDYRQMGNGEGRLKQRKAKLNKGIVDDYRRETKKD